MKSTNRRQFLIRSGIALGASAKLARAGPIDGTDTRATTQYLERPVEASNIALVNKNLRTAIGLGDEPAATVDGFGQLLRSHHAGLRVELGSPLQPAECAKWSQSLLDGYLPIVQTHLESGGSSLHLSAFSSDAGGAEADYVGIQGEKGRYRVRLVFPYTTSLEVGEGVVSDGGKALALFPPAREMHLKLAKYNLMTPEAYSSLRPPWDPNPGPSKLLPDVDPAFGAYRRNYLNRGIEYRFPVRAGNTYNVFMGIVPTAQKPGEELLRLKVNEETQLFDYAMFPAQKPAIQEFTVTADTNELRVISECDPSESGPWRACVLSGIWVFDSAVDARKVVKGHLSSRALFYVQCGNEPVEDIVSSVTLDYDDHATSEMRWFRFPYDQQEDRASDVEVVSPEGACRGQKSRWESLLQNAAEFKTGVPQLDNLYKTSLINLLLLRTRFQGRGKDGQDIYVVKPGIDIYDTFWIRDGSYIITALDLAGLPEEAEKSLRLLWHPNLTGTLASWGQQPSGLWAAPTWQWDGQGQALWALVNHFEYTHDEEWLRQVYPNLVRGVRWIKSATEQTQFVNENGERPIYYGLLPLGEGESIAQDFNYYHCFWAVLGLRQVIRAAQALRQTDDVAWVQELHDEFCSNLLASVKLAYRRIGNDRFIPATPFDPKAPIWGSAAALYPARFLDPHDPMMTSSLEVLDDQAQEDSYLYERDHLWTVITVEGAMCHLLRDELPAFYRLYNGYVAHVSPTNGWSEGIFLKDRKGTGDMPHGWGAAEYVFIHRNSLVYENEDSLELCWGVQPAWLKDGAKLAVKGAPTKFGKIDMNLERSGPELALNFHRSLAGAQPEPVATRFHIPKLKEGITSIRINGQTRTLPKGDSVIMLD